MSRKGIWRVVGLGFSAAAVALLVAQVDVDALLAVSRRFDFRYLPLYVLSAWATWLCMGARWWLMMDRELRPAEALAAWVFGLGTNQVVPMRGGDALRVVFSARRADWPLAQVVGRAASERMVDLGVLVGCGAAALAWTGARGEPRVFTALTTVLIVAAALGLLLRFANARVVRSLGWLAQRSGLGKRFDVYLREPLQDLGGFLRVRRLRLPLVLTVLAWAGFSVVSYWSIGAALGVELAFPATLLLVFMGATSLAVPSAPGGVGVFHAALWSGFLLLGRDGSAGLAFATILHALQMASIGLLVVALVPVWTRARAAPGASAASARTADAATDEEPARSAATR